MNDNSSESFDCRLANSRLHPGLEGTKINDKNRSSDRPVNGVGNNFAKGVIKR